MIVRLHVNPWIFTCTACTEIRGFNFFLCPSHNISERKRITTGGWTRRTYSYSSRHLRRVTLSHVACHMSHCFPCHMSHVVAVVVVVSDGRRNVFARLFFVQLSSRCQGTYDGGHHMCAHIFVYCVFMICHRYTSVTHHFYFFVYTLQQ
jgi:hypothetical protein